MSSYDRFEDQDVLDLVAAYPLAWVMVRAGKGGEGSLLPLLAQTGPTGRLTGLLGHMARSNVLFDHLSADPSVLVLFQGPQGYISGSWVRDRRWVPTWNYAQLQLTGELRFHPEGGAAALEALVDAMESGRPEAWRIEESGARYPALEQAIIAFDIEVQELTGRFKLGQDERTDILADILDHLPDPELALWMRRFNRGRC